MYSKCSEHMNGKAIVVSSARFHSDEWHLISKQTITNRNKERHLPINQRAVSNQFTTFVSVCEMMALPGGGAIIAIYTQLCVLKWIPIRTRLEMNTRYDEEKRSARIKLLRYATMSQIWIDYTM